MTKRMLIDATHPEETRVAVVSNNKLEEYDYETLVRKQLKSNIYLVKVTRVEPSLQAAFVDFGGNRHGFLPFPEIHADYYRIPIADREALIAEEREIAAAQAAKEDAEDAAELAAEGLSLDDVTAESADSAEEEDAADNIAEVEQETYEPEVIGAIAEDAAQPELHAAEDESENEAEQPETADHTAQPSAEGEDDDDEDSDDSEDAREAPVFRSNRRRHYKIQEVIKRNQIMLIQINKEERGNKGAAVTSYISLPGRYCVLMPNSPRGGGVSRKVSSAKDRQRLKKILAELEVPEGMSVILRTAGVSRSHAEIKRDLDYLLRLWDQIRELTLKSTAPALIYEEGNLIKRAIRDLYRREIDEVHVAGEEGFKTAHDFMKTLMPSHADRVQLYNDPAMPLFTRHQVEKQIDEIHNPTVHLRSGGYIVINPTEAMVSIDVNSGKATKGRHIEETALKTNLEAADEIARQLRLRDQGGLVVIDFIDMEDRRGNRIVEKRLRDAMAGDRARIQLGRISAFGLLELSRQRLNPSLVETNFETCKHCNGVGVVRTVETAGVMILRALEEEALRARGTEVRITVPTEVALYIFNHKREMIALLEKRHGIRIFISADDKMLKPNYTIESTRSQNAAGNRPQRLAPVQTVDISDLPDIPESEITDDSTVSDDDRLDSDISFNDGGEGRHDRRDRGGDRGGRNRRGGRGRDRHRGGGGRDRDDNRPAQAVGEAGDGNAAPSGEQSSAEGRNGGEGRHEGNGESGDKNRRRRRRGGRNRGGRDRRDGPNGDRGGHAAQGQGQSQQQGQAQGDRPQQAPAGTGEQPSIFHPVATQQQQQAPAPRQQSPASEQQHYSSSGGEGEEGGNRKGWWKRLTE